jgi:hypothetical protein
MSKKVRYDFLLDAHEVATVKKLQWTAETVSETVYRHLGYLANQDIGQSFDKIPPRSAIVYRTTIRIPEGSIQEQTLRSLWNKDRCKTIQRVLFLMSKMQHRKEMGYKEFLCEFQALVPDDRMVPGHLMLEFFEGLVSKARLSDYIQRLEREKVGSRLSLDPRRKTASLIYSRFPKVSLPCGRFNLVKVF